MKYKIRRAIPSDIPEIVNLCEEHAEYEKAEYSKIGKAEALEFFLFSQQSILNCLIVENESEILGYATYTFEFSTWDAAFYTHMDCLFLRPEYRNFGIGESLIIEIAKQSKQNGIKQMQWQTPIFNERAIKFYHRIGAKSKEKIRLYYNCQ